MKTIYTLFLALLFVSCGSEEELAPRVLDVPEPVEAPTLPNDAVVSAMGTFTGFAHDLMGKAILYLDGQEKRTLRLENYTMTQGPDVYVFLSTSNNYSKANTIAIAMLKNGYAGTALHIDVAPAIDTSKHKFVLVYCLEFNSLFGFAELE